MERGGGGVDEARWGRRETAALPLAMVIGRFFVRMATTIATTPAPHSLGPPESSDTATRETIRQPGKARNLCAHAPSLGICCPIRTPDSRIANVPTVRARMTNQVSVMACCACRPGPGDAAEYQRPSSFNPDPRYRGGNHKDH